MSLINANPTVFAPSQHSHRRSARNQGLWMHVEEDSEEESDVDPIDAQEIFGQSSAEQTNPTPTAADLIRSISDPEHPLSLESLRVVSVEQVELGENSVMVEFTPTVPHCGMSTIIGLCIRVRLMRSLPARFKVDMRVKPGSHQSELAVNKQLNDKERVAAALENPALVEMVEKCLSTASRGSCQEHDHPH